MVPVLVIPGQKDDIIIGTNMLKYVLHQIKTNRDYCELILRNAEGSSECEQFLDLIANTSRSRGEELPDKIGTVKLTQAVTLIASSSSSIVGRVVTPMWGDRWVPMKVTNLSDKPITLKRNCKLADVSPCLAVEDFEVFQGCSQHMESTSEEKQSTSKPDDLKQRIKDVGLGDVNIDLCHLDHSGKEKLVQLLEKYNNVFSKHALDCGEAEGFVHCIWLTDERPFRLPFWRVPTAHYQKLRQVLTEMEEQGIIRKSVSEYASPLVLVWKKDGSLRICTDFRWLNARTLKDAHPLPHQVDCLAALGGNVFFSTMD